MMLFGAFENNSDWASAFARGRVNIAIAAFALAAIAVCDGSLAATTTCPRGRVCSTRTYTTTVRPASQPVTRTPNTTVPPRGYSKTVRTNAQTNSGANNTIANGGANNSTANKFPATISNGAVSPPTIQGNPSRNFGTAAGLPGNGSQKSPYASLGPPRNNAGTAYIYHGNAFAPVRSAPYHWPSGQSYQRYARGMFLPRAYWAPNYFVADYADYGLDAPAAGYSWIQYGTDMLQISLSDGQVGDAVYGFYNAPDMSLPDDNTRQIALANLQNMTLPDDPGQPAPNNAPPQIYAPQPNDPAGNGADAQANPQGMTLPGDAGQPAPNNAPQQNYPQQPNYPNYAPQPNYPMSNGAVAQANAGTDWVSMSVDGAGHWAWQWDPSPDNARNRSLARCGQQGCMTAFTVQAHCIGYAESRTQGYWFGIVYGPDHDSVQSGALNECSAKAPPNSCYVVRNHCQGEQDAPQRPTATGQ